MLLGINRKVSVLPGRAPYKQVMSVERVGSHTQSAAASAIFNAVRAHSAGTPTQASNPFVATW